MEKGYAAPVWMTFKQATELKASVRKGEHGSLVVYADKIIRTETDAKTGEDSEHAIPFLKGYTVFNVEQIDGLPEHLSLEQLASISPTVDAADLRLEDLPSSSLKTFEQAEATPELIAEVKSALAEAHTAAKAAVDSFLLTARYVDGGKFVADVCGWADLVIDDSQSSVVSALVAMGKTTIIGVCPISEGMGDRETKRFP